MVSIDRVTIRQLNLKKNPPYSYAFTDTVNRLLLHIIEKNIYCIYSLYQNTLKNIYQNTRFSQNNTQIINTIIRRNIP